MNSSNICSAHSGIRSLLGKLGSPPELISISLLTYFLLRSSDIDALTSLSLHADYGLQITPQKSSIFYSLKAMRHLVKNTSGSAYFVPL